MDATFVLEIVKISAVVTILVNIFLLGGISALAYLLERHK